MKRETQGMDPKVPVQAIATLLVFLLGYFGVNLTPELAGAISIVVGSLAAIFAPAANTQLVPHTERRLKPRDETGQYDPMYVLLFLIVLIVLVWLALHLFHT